MVLRFTREERLKSEKVIQNLFQGGQSLGHYPFRLVWKQIREQDSPGFARIAISVPKKKYPKAVTRNRIKRVVREAYRLNKARLTDFCTTQSLQVSFMIIYTGTEELPFSELELKMKEMLHRFIRKLSASS